MSKLVGARVYNSGNISIATGVVTYLTFDSERYDYDTIHDLGVNPGRLTCQTAGIYLIIGNVGWASHATGYRSQFIRLNGATFISANIVNPDDAASITQTPSTIYELAVSDYVEVGVLQTSGGNLNVEAAANYSPEFMMQRIG